VAGGAVAIVAAGFVVASDRLGNRSAGEPPTAAGPTTESSPAPADDGARLSHHHSSPPPVTTPLSDAEAAARDGELARTTAALPGPTVADALAAGYRITNDLEAPGDVHLARDDWVDDAFDPARPEQLLAAGRRPGDRLLAAVFWVETGPEDPPEGFTGSGDWWHRHDGTICVDAAGVAVSVPPEGCTGGGLRPAGYGGWMLHAWVAADFPNPDGVFAIDNPCLAPDDPGRPCA